MHVECHRRYHLKLKFKECMDPQLRCVKKKLENGPGIGKGKKHQDRENMFREIVNLKYLKQEIQEQHPFSIHLYNAL